MADNVTIKWEGFDKMITQLRRFGVDVTKRSEQLKIYRRQAKPYQKALRSPGIIKDAKKSVVYFRDKSITYEPGNARKSIKMFANRGDRKNKTFILVGPQAKKAENSGYYLWFHLPGTPGNAKKNDWIKKAFDRSKSEMVNGVSKELTKYMTTVAKKRGFST